MSRTLMLFCCLTIAGLLAGCKGQEENAYQPPPPPEVTVSKPAVQDVIRYDDYTGTVAAYESVEIRPRVSGYIAKVCFKAGSEVKEGDLLYVIDPRPYKAALDEAKANLAIDTANAEFRKFDYQRTVDLSKKDAASQYELSKSKATYDAALAQIDAAKAKVEQAELNLGFTEIRAPFGGNIDRTQVDPGNLVSENASSSYLTRIVKVNPIYVYFTVNEQALLGYIRQSLNNDIPVEQRKSPPILLGLMDEDGYPHVGRLDSSENQVDPNTGTIKIRAIFENKDEDLGPGLFARIRIPVGLQKNALLVPDRAIGTDQGGKYLLVVNNQDVVEKVPVQTGRQVGDLRVIEKGLDPSQRVVINGLQRAREGVKVKTEQVTTSAPAPATLPALPTFVEPTTASAPAK